MTELDAELEGLKTELSWVLKEEVPVVLAQLGTLLKSVIKRLDDPVPFDSFAQPILAAAATPLRTGSFSSFSGNLPAIQESARNAVTQKITSPDNRIYGSIRIDGAAVVGGELNIQFPERMQTHLHTSVRQGPATVVKIEFWGKKPWIIYQIKEARLMLERVLEEIDATSLQHGLSFTRTQVIRVVESITKLLKAAKDKLEFPCTRSLSDNMSYMRTVLRAPPTDVVIDFSVQDAQLNVICFIVSDVGPVGTTTNKSTKSVERQSIIGQQYNWKEHNFEVLDQTTGVCDLDFLRESLASVYSLHELSQRLLDKIQAFSAIPCEE